MFAALPVAADVVASLALSDRTETRVRDPGDNPGEPSLDVATTPDARLTLVSPRTSFMLAYTPRLTLWDINDIGFKPLWLHAGTARLDWKDEHTSIYASQDASYGATNFASLILGPTTSEGIPPRVDVIPTPQIIQYESSTSSLGTRLEGRRWALRTDVGYQLAGGADEASRLVVPLQKGPAGDAVMTLASSPVDHLPLTLTASETTFSSGPEILIGEADEGWLHRWSAVTETGFTLGVSEARVQPSPIVPSYTQTNPVADAVLEQRLWAYDGVLSLRVDARLGPVVNRLLGIVDERVQCNVLSKWTRGPFAASGFASAAQSVPTDGPYATELVSGELDLSYTATEAVVFDAGLRGFWQRANQPVVAVSVPGATEIVEASLVQGVVFVGVTLHAPTVRL